MVFFNFKNRFQTFVIPIPRKSLTINLFIFLSPFLLLQNCTFKNSKEQPQYNLGFEAWTDRSGLSDGWSTWGNQKVEIDSTWAFKLEKM